MDDLPLYAVIMAGGSGTRFWPASRRSLPKQFLSIAGDESLLSATYRRIVQLVPDERLLVVTRLSQVPLVKQCIPGLPPENILAEPVSRNTAPCVALAAAEIRRRNPEAVQIFMPADHVIQPASSFRASLSAAAAEAAKGEHLVTLGVRPGFAATQYGYIEVGERLHEVEGIAVYAALRFVEKPSVERAREFAASGNFYWNSGIFVWSTAAITAALEQHAPQIQSALEGVESTEELERVYPELDAESIDVAVMEKADNVRMLPIDYAWNDVGSWSAVGDVHGKDEAGNCSAGGGQLLAREAKNCIVYGPEGHLTALIGVEDLVVVQAGGATLVCPRDRAHEVREIVRQLESKAPEFL